MHTTETLTTLAIANAELRAHRYSTAIELYKIAILQHPELSQTINFNIQFALDRITRNATDHYIVNDIEENTVDSLSHFDAETDQSNATPNTVVVVHVFYEHLWGQISRQLDNISTAFKLIITHPETNFQNIQKTISAKYPYAYFMPVSNIGMDVLPFIKAVSKFELWNYDAVLKLHTKNDKTEDRQIQGKMLIDGVLGSKSTVQRILDKFSKNASIGLIGSELLFRSGDLLMYNNRELYETLLKTLGLNKPDEPFGFIAGTTFWVKGALLKVFETSQKLLENLFLSDELAHTGGDGTYAHAMERVFGALPTSLGYKIAVSYPASTNPLEYEIKPIDNQLILNNPSYRTGSGTHIARYKNLESLVNTIRSSSLFDENYYKNQLPPKTLAKDDPAVHYVLNGELFLANPSAEFDSRYYSARYKDITRTRSPGLAHYINHGRRENRIRLPLEMDIIQLGIREGLIDASWSGKAEELLMILKHGSPENCMAVYSKNFNPYQIPKLSYIARTNSGLDTLKIYLSGVFHEELELYDLIERTWSNQDYVKCRELASKAINDYGNNKMSLEVLGGSQLLLGDWESAADTFQTYWTMVVTKGKIVERAKSSVLRIDQPTAENDDFQIIKHAPWDKVFEYNTKRICIYTTLFGNIDDLLPVISNTYGIDLICFSDVPRRARGWDVRVVTSDYATANLSAKTYKILPHKYLAEYEYSLFVDANTLFLGRLDLLIKLCLAGGEFVMWRHPLRRDVYKECIAIVASKRHEPKSLIRQISNYSKLGFPRDSGLTEGSFIWRSHSDENTLSFMQAWWEEIMHGSSRDQVSLGYLMWSKKFKPAVFPASIGSSRDNVFFVKVPHNFETARSAISVQKKPPRPRNIVFLYSKLYAGSGSTVMRGEQLSNLVKHHYQGKRTVSYKHKSDTIKNSIIILTKGFLKSTSIHELEALRLAGNILLADFVDDIPDAAKLPFVDALIASSIAGYKHYMTKLSHIPSFHLTHHVDPRIIKVVSSKLPEKYETCNIGYFGESLNAKQSPDIMDYIDFHMVDTSKKSSSWIPNVIHYNCHYAVRERRGIDGFKPFLKGFTAAATGSNIIIQRDEGDAAYYLGSDYPYLVSGEADEAEIHSMLMMAKETYGSPVWDSALDIMSDVRTRSSMNYVLGEFEEMINSLER